MIARLADAQYGVVARWQLANAGVTRKAVQVRLERDRLVRLHRGVYAVGHRRLRREGYWLAAVLAAGPGGVLSHRDAAALYDLRPSNRSTVDVTVVGRRSKPVGISLHRVTVLDPADVSVVRGIPVTSVARTLLDLAGVVASESLAKALSEADRLNLLDVRALEAARGRTRGRRGLGHARLAAALAQLQAQSTTLTRSSLEIRFSTLLAKAGLPRPQTNVYVEGREVDAYWPDHRLVVELDGWEFHRSRRAFERDRAKDAELTAKAYRVVRFTHHELTRRPANVIEALRRLLAMTSSPPRATMSGPCP